METYHLTQDIQAFGFRVHTFPEGISEAFDNLMDKIEHEKDRPYFGISWCNGNEVTYIAGAAELKSGEGKALGFESYEIPKGAYLSKKIENWSSQTAIIKDVFENLKADERSSSNHPAIEYYIDDTEMLCLVKMNTMEELVEAFDDITQQLYFKLLELDEETINRQPADKGWTVGQMFDHLHKSDTFVTKLLMGNTIEANRKKDLNVDKIRKSFEDYSRKMVSPEPILPDLIDYNKAISATQFDSDRKKLLVHLIHCKQDHLYPDFPMGALTGFELGWFVVAHSKRHLQQLNKILDSLSS